MGLGCRGAAHPTPRDCPASFPRLGGAGFLNVEWRTATLRCHAVDPKVGSAQEGHQRPPYPLPESASMTQFKDGWDDVGDPVLSD